HGFLHDFAEMTSHGELLATAHAGGLDEDDVSADWSPHQTDCDSGFLDALRDFFLRAELRHAQEFADDFRGDHHFFGFAFGDTARLFSRDRSDLALQIAHTSLSRVAVD